MKFSNEFLYATLAFMRAANAETGLDEEKVEAMLDAFDPSLKRTILLMVIKGEYVGNFTIREDTTLPAKQKINAIKAVRGATGYGLKEAKDAVDDVDRYGTFTIPGEYSYDKRRQLERELHGTGYYLL